jgi:hypothetical protein
MEGMRYERGGKGKYWIPKPGEANSRTPLLSGDTSQSTMPPGKPQQSDAQFSRYGNGTLDDQSLDPEEECLYESARELEFGDWNVSNFAKRSNLPNLQRASPDSI